MFSEIDLDKSRSTWDILLGPCRGIQDICDMKCTLHGDSIYQVCT